MDKQPQKRQIQVELDEKARDGTYSNFVLTANTNSEFIFDFARMLPGVQKAKVFSRIIMTPQSAKTFHHILEQTIDKFEDNFGEIKLPGKDSAQGIGFQSAPQPRVQENKKKK